MAGVVKSGKDFHCGCQVSSFWRRGYSVGELGRFLSVCKIMNPGKSQALIIANREKLMESKARPEAFPDSVISGRLWKRTESEIHFTSPP